MNPFGLLAALGAGGLFNLGTALQALDAREAPADVRVQQPAQRAAQPVPVVDVRRVRVALLVGERMVLAVVGDPGDHRALDRG